MVENVRHSNRILNDKMSTIDKEVENRAKEIASATLTQEFIPMMKASMRNATKLSSKSIDNVISDFLDNFTRRSNELFAQSADEGEKCETPVEQA